MIGRLASTGGHRLFPFPVTFGFFAFGITMQGVVCERTSGRGPAKPTILT